MKGFFAHEEMYISNIQIKNLKSKLKISMYKGLYLDQKINCKLWVSEICYIYFAYYYKYYFAFAKKLKPTENNGWLNSHYMTWSYKKKPPRLKAI